MKQIPFFLLEPCPLVRLGFERLVAMDRGLRLAGSSENCCQLTERLAETQAETLVFEPFAVKTPDADWLKKLRAHRPSLGLIAFSAQITDMMGLKKLIRNGVQGILPKNATPTEISTAIRAVASGAFYVQPGLETSLCQRTLGIRAAAPTMLFAQKISRREQEILELIVREFTSREISAKLFISFETVETHRSNLIHKMGVKNTAGLVREAVQCGLV